MIGKSDRYRLNGPMHGGFVVSLLIIAFTVGACSNPSPSRRTPRERTERALANRPLEVATRSDRSTTASRRSTRSATRRGTVNPRIVETPPDKPKPRYSRSERNNPSALRRSPPPRRTPVTTPTDAVALNNSPVSPAVDAQPLDASAPPRSRVYHVQPNDTLWSLAKKFYGDSKHWRRILAANRNRVPDPTALPVGIKLIIP